MNLMRLLSGFALLLLALGAPAARAQTGHQGIDDYFATVDAFERLTARGPPRLTDAAAAAILRRLADPEATFGNEVYTLSDMPVLGRLLMRSMAVPMYYMRRDIPENAPRAVYRPQQGRNSTDIRRK